MKTVRRKPLLVVKPRESSLVSSLQKKPAAHESSGTGVSNRLPVVRTGLTHKNQQENRPTALETQCQRLAPAAAASRPPFPSSNLQPQQVQSHARHHQAPSHRERNRTAAPIVPAASQHRSSQPQTPMVYASNQFASASSRYNITRSQMIWQAKFCIQSKKHSTYLMVESFGKPLCARTKLQHKPQIWNVECISESGVTAEILISDEQGWYWNVKKSKIFLNPESRAILVATRRHDGAYELKTQEGVFIAVSAAGNATVRAKTSTANSRFLFLKIVKDEGVPNIEGTVPVQHYQAVPSHERHMHSYAPVAPAIAPGVNVHVASPLQTTETLHVQTQQGHTIDLTHLGGRRPDARAAAPMAPIAAKIGRKFVTGTGQGLANCICPSGIYPLCSQGLLRASMARIHRLLREIEKRQSRKKSTLLKVGSKQNDETAIIRPILLKDARIQERRCRRPCLLSIAGTYQVQNIERKTERKTIIPHALNGGNLTPPSNHVQHAPPSAWQPEFEDDPQVTLAGSSEASWIAALKGGVEERMCHIDLIDLHEELKVSSGEGLPADCGGGIRPPFARWGKWQIEYVQKELDVPFLNTCNEDVWALLNQGNSEHEASRVG